MRPKTVGHYKNTLNPEENEIAFIASPTPGINMATPEI